MQHVEIIHTCIANLCLVCFRYKTVGRRHKQNLTPVSNTATTLDDKNSTEMHPLQGEDRNQEEDKYDNIKANPIVNVHNAETGEIHEETTLTVTPTYETTIFHFNRQPEGHEDHLVYDSKSGISSFLSQSLNRNVKSKPNDHTPDSLKQNSLLQDKPDSPIVHTMKPEIAQSNVPNIVTSSNMRDSLHHYKVDNQEYAVVLRSPHRNRNFSGKVAYSVTNDNRERPNVEHSYVSMEDFPK